jgi:cytochrome c biogenesis protein CcmG, thiol:disulfide interchange protein DsbE
LNRKSIMLLAGGLLIGVLLGFLIINGSGRTPGESGQARRDAPAKGLPLADFELPSLVEGEIVKLSDYRGTPVVVNFWGTWCPPCKEEMPLLQSVYEDYSPDLVIIGVNAMDAVGTVEQFVESTNLTFPIALDQEGKVQSQYLVRGFPTTFFIDKDGVLQDQHIGILNERLLNGYLQKIGAGR